MDLIPSNEEIVTKHDQPSMNKRSTFLTIIILLSSFVLKVNAQVEISGQIKDHENKVSIPFCNISVYNQQDSLITGGISNDNGFFKVPLKSGSYTLIVSYVGCVPDTLHVDVGQESKFLGVIRMQPKETALGEVQVKGSSRAYTIDKDVQMVTTAMRTGSANTSEVLERMNGISYDRYNRSIKVDGDARVILLVNGLEKDQEYIKNLSPDRLKEVEIIRDPSGRYALEGYTAVINIILKNDYRGTEIHLVENAIFDPDAYASRYVPINYGALTFNYTYNKVNLYLKGNSMLNTFIIPGKVFQSYSDGTRIDYNQSDSLPNMDVRNITNSYTAGIDYYLNPKHTLSFESNVSDFPGSSQFTDQLFDVTHYQNDSLIDRYTAKTLNESKTKDYSGTLFYIYNISEGTRLNAEFTYDRYTDVYLNSLDQSNGFKRNENGTNAKDYTKFYVEFSHSLNAKSALMAGYGNTWRSLENHYISETQLLPNEGFTSDTADFGMTETRHKLYAYYSLAITPKLGFKVGAAAEYSRPRTETTDHSYLIYQPYLDLNFAAHEMLNIKLKYRTESEYPSIKQITPFTQVMDPYSIEVGNPELQPSTIHDLSVRFRFLQGLISVEPYYGFSNNQINRVATPLGGTLYQYSYENVGNYRSHGIKGDITLPLFQQSLILKTDVDLFSKSITYNERKNTVKDWTMTTQVLYIDKKYHTVAGVNYQKGLYKNINAQGYDYYNNDFWMLLVQQPFLKGKLTLMLAWILPIDFGASFNQGSYTDAGTYTSTGMYDISMLKNFLLFNVTYRFNHGKSVKTLEKEIKKEVEKEAKGIF